MKLVRTRTDADRLLADVRRSGKRVGLVPTMGSFHRGHLELMKLARSRAAFTVVSMFVNPLQFAPVEDLERYPRDERRDSELASDAGVDLLFAPDETEMYAQGRSTFVEETELSRGLCGASRPDHFRGVTTVVAKLFNILRPDIAVFGRKDLQQLMVIRRMVRDLDMPVEIVEAPVVREPDGLALSSRNVYLSLDERGRAPGMFITLLETGKEIAGGQTELGKIITRSKALIGQRTGGKLEYLEALDAELRGVSRSEDCAFLAAALHLGATRLIDNLRVPPGATGD